MSEVNEVNASSPTLALLNKKVVGESGTVSKAKAKKAVQGEETAVVGVFASVSKEVENLTEGAAMNMARTLIEQGGLNDFKLGGVLSVIQANGWWQNGGYGKFKDFIDTELNIPYRKAMYLIQIYVGLVESGVPWDEVAVLGWTKLKELASVMSLSNYAEWVDKASKMTVLQLQEYLKVMKEQVANGTLEEGDEEVVAVSTLTFKVHSDQKEVVKQALEAAKKAHKTEFDNVALEHIALTYISEGAGALTLKDQLSLAGIDDAMDAFQAAFPSAKLSVEFEDFS